MVEYGVSDDEQKQFDSPINIIKSSVIENTQDVSNESQIVFNSKNTLSSTIFDSSIRSLEILSDTFELKESTHSSMLSSTVINSSKNNINDQANQNKFQIEKKSNTELESNLLELSFEQKKSSKIISLDVENISDKLQDLSLVSKFKIPLKRINKNQFKIHSEFYIYDKVDFVFFFIFYFKLKFF